MDSAEGRDRGARLGIGLLGLLLVLGGSVGFPGPSADPAIRPAARVLPDALAWSGNVRVNSGSLGYSYQVEPTLAVNGTGGLFVGWKEADTHNGSGQRVSFSVSADGGSTFSPSILMELSEGTRQSDPWLAVAPNGTVYFARLEFAGLTAYSGLGISSTRDGIAWGPSHYLDDSPNFADKETLAVGPDGSLNLVYNSDSPTEEDLVFVRSDDGGATWTAKVRVPDALGGVIGGVVGVLPNGTRVVAWYNYTNGNVYADRSTDGGATWGRDVQVNDVAGSGVWRDWVLTLPALAIDPSGIVYLAWADERRGSPDIFVSSSRDGGLTWSPNVRVNDDVGSATQWQAELAVDPWGHVHAAWYDARTGNLNVAYARSGDGGTTWSSNTFITDAETPSMYTRPGDYFALESGPDGTIYAVWTDGRGPDLDIYFAKLPPAAQITVETVPSGLSVEVDGVSVRAPSTFFWIVGSNHSLSAPSIQALGSGTRATFSAWADGGLRVRTVRTDGADTSYRALYSLEHLLTVTSPYGAPTGGGWHPAGADVVLSVEATVRADDRTFAFAGWTGDLVSAENPLTVPMDGPLNLTATWTDVTPASPPWWIIGALAALLASGVVVLLVLRRRRKGAP